MVSSITKTKREAKRSPKIGQPAKPRRITVSAYLRVDRGTRKAHVGSWTISEGMLDRLSACMSELVAEDHEHRAALIREQPAQQNSDAPASVRANTSSPAGLATGSSACVPASHAAAGRVNASPSGSPSPSTQVQPA